MREFPDNEWTQTVCRIGQGHDCCRYLTMGRNNWSCEKKSEMKQTIDLKVLLGQFTARADNCDGLGSR